MGDFFKILTEGLGDKGTAITDRSVEHPLLIEKVDQPLISLLTCDTPHPAQGCYDNEAAHVKAPNPGPGS